MLHKWSISVLLPVFGLIALHLTAAYAHPTEPRGAIKGRVVDSATKLPLIGVNVVVMGTERGDATDDDGGFQIPNLSVGSYSLQFNYMGYEKLIKPDVIVRSQRTAFLEVELRESAVKMADVVVSGSYFPVADEQPTSTARFSFEEIRRAPGSAGDVSRILMSLPSLAKVNDQSNQLIVRGGSPMENAFYLDNIEVPNINHFPTQGVSGGPIGMVNVDFVQEVNFSAGGFSAICGDRLSAIMELTLREGNRDEFDGQLDLNFAGFGGVAEGSLGKRGSYLLSARRSYLDLLVKAIDVGSTVAPRYGDYQWKMVYDLSPRHRVSLLGLWGDDHNNPDRETAIENDMTAYGNQDIYERTTGLNWRALWGGRGYSNTSLSHTSTEFREEFHETNTAGLLFTNRSHEQAIKLRNVNHFKLNDWSTIEFGLEAKQLITDYDNFYAEFTDALGETVAALTLDDHFTSQKLGLFASATLQPSDVLTTTIGIRSDYFSYTENQSISPRLALSYQLNERTSLHVATGLYHQSLPLILLSQHAANRDLKEPIARHAIIGLNHMLSDDTKLSLELYQKEYEHFPIDPAQSSLFVIDELFYRYGFFLNHEPLSDRGKARTRGLEIMMQKKLAKNFYGLASASYFRSRYRGGDEVWHDRVFDNRGMVSLEGGYKPNNKWEFSLRWIYAGGAPYTPLDLAASAALNRTVLDDMRINAVRYPAYHSLNLRLDRRFHYTGSNLVFYFSVWNAYNRKNVASYFWNANEQKEEAIYQWGALPIFGLEFEY